MDPHQPGFGSEADAQRAAETCRSYKEEKPPLKIPTLLVYSADF